MPYLADVNVWIALLDPRHAHHREAVVWFDNMAEDDVILCRVVAMGILRLSTNARVMADAVLTTDEAWGALAAFKKDPRVRFAEERADVEPVWSRITSGMRLSPASWTDSYLAAFAICEGAELVTLDRSFYNYGGLTVRVI